MAGSGAAAVDYGTSGGVLGAQQTASVISIQTYANQATWSGWNYRYMLGSSQQTATVTYAIQNPWPHWNTQYVTAGGLLTGGQSAQSTNDHVWRMFVTSGGQQFQTTYAITTEPDWSTWNEGHYKKRADKMRVRLHHLVEAIAAAGRELLTGLGRLCRELCEWGKTEEKREAEARATALLEAHLTPEQRAEWAAKKTFHVRTAKGRVIRLAKAHPPREIDREKRKAVRQFCIHPDYALGLPPEDILLMHKLWLEVDEERWLKTANASPFYEAA